jgi:hypothetical protein
MKKPVRLLLLGTGLFVAGIAGVGLLALQSGVQTWAARRALAGQPSLKARVGQVSAGFETVALHDVHFEQDGAQIALPSFLAELSVIDAGLNKKIHLRRLVARGWTLDLTAYKFPEAAAPGAGAAAVAAAPAAAVAQVFHGVFAQAALPFDLTLDGVELEGVVKAASPAPGIASGWRTSSSRAAGWARARGRVHVQRDDRAHRHGGAREFVVGDGPFRGGDGYAADVFAPRDPSRSLGAGTAVSAGSETRRGCRRYARHRR